MPYVTNKLTWGTGGLHYVLKPFLSEDLKPSRGKYSQQEIDRVYAAVKKEAENTHKTGRLRIFRIYHEQIKPRLSELKENRNMLITSQSVNRTVEDKFYGTRPYAAIMDPFSDTSVLPDKIMEGIIKYSEKWQDVYGEDPKKYYENEVFHPVGPFIFPYMHKKTGKTLEIVHRFEDAVKKTNELAESEGLGSRIGMTRRTFGTNPAQNGSYEFAEMLYMKSSALKAKIEKYGGYGYDANFAKRMLPYLPEDIGEYFSNFFGTYEFKKDRMNILPKRQAEVFKNHYDYALGKAIHLNCEITWDALKNAIFKPLNIEKIETISMEGSYVRNIIPKEKTIPWGVMDNSKYSKKKETSTGAVNRILGGLWDVWEEDRRKNQPRV